MTDQDRTQPTGGPTSSNPTADSDDTVAFGATEQPGPRRLWSRQPQRTVLASLASVAVLAAAATGVALATDTPSPSPSESQTPGGTGQHDRGGMRGGPGIGFGIGGPGIGALHGEFVVPKSGGGYQTVVMQRGAVTAVSDDTVSVKSDDGYTATYDVKADAVMTAKRDGLASIEKGDKVSVVATQDSGNDTALRVVDESQLMSQRGTFGGRGPGGPGQPGQSGESGSSSQGTAFRVA